MLGMNTAVMVGLVWLGQFPPEIRECVVEAVREHGPEAAQRAAYVHESYVGGMPLLGFIPTYDEVANHADLARGVQCWLRDAMLANWDLEKIKKVLMTVGGISESYAQIVAARVWTPDKCSIDFVTSFVRDLPDIPFTTLDDVLKGKLASMLSGLTTTVLPELQTGNTDNLFQARMLGKEIRILRDRAVDNAFQDRYTGVGYDPPKDASGNIDWAKVQAVATAVMPAALGGLSRLVGRVGGGALGSGAKALGGGSRAAGLLPAAGRGVGSAVADGTFTFAGGDIADGYDEGGDVISPESIEEASRACELLIQAARGGQVHPNALRTACETLAGVDGMPAAHGDFLSDAAGFVGGMFGGKAGEGVARGAASLLGNLVKGAGGGKSKPGQPASADPTIAQFQRDAMKLLRDSATAHRTQTRQLNEIIAANQGNYRKVMSALGILTRAVQRPQLPAATTPSSSTREVGRGDDAPSDPVARALTS